MATITFYPLGNADSSLTKFEDGRLMLIDYCDCKDPNDKKDRRIDLPEELRAELARRDREDFDMVAFTHADNDHVAGAEDFFWLDHADKYQGEGRVRIKELWVPANSILEQETEGSARAIRQEARYRVKKNGGVRVFGNRGCLDEWLKVEGIKPETRHHLITHAGELVPGFSRDEGNAELFVHSPFAFRMLGEEVDRNNACLVLQVAFFAGGNPYRVMFSGDAEWEAWRDIDYISQKNGNSDRLKWDGFKIAHHCSYTALGPEKGDEETEPALEVAHLFDQGQPGCILVSSSEPIPTEDTDLPPHKQAAAYYERVRTKKEGEFVITMETPSTEHPEPIIIEITYRGLLRRKRSATPSAVAAVVARPSPRVG